MIINNRIWSVVLKLREVFEADPYAHRIEFKPFPAFPSWKGFLDLTDMDNSIVAAQTTADEALNTAQNVEGTAYNTVFHAHSEDMEVIFGTPNRVISSSFPFNGGKYMNQQNAAIAFYVNTGSGQLNLKVLTVRANGYGIVRAFWNGDLIDTLDCYAVASDFAYEWSMSVSNVIAGQNTLSFDANTKNGASSGYAMFIQHVRGRLI